MLTFRNTALSLCIAAGLASGALAQTGGADHQQHHPDQTQPNPKPATNVPAPKAAPQEAAPAMAPDPAMMTKMDEHIKAMQAMHDKFAAAKTPEERQALMADQAKLMREGMAFLHQMSGGMMGGAMMAQGAGGQGMMSGNLKGSGAMGMGGQPGDAKMMENMSQRHQMMAKRMDMMESMMQMMVDRLPPAR